MYFYFLKRCPEFHFLSLSLKIKQGVSILLTHPVYDDLAHRRVIHEPCTLNDKDLIFVLTLKEIVLYFSNKFLEGRIFDT